MLNNIFFNFHLLLVNLYVYKDNFKNNMFIFKATL